MLPGGLVGLEAALELRDVDPQLALSLLEALLAEHHEVLAPLNLLLAKLEIRLEDGAAPLELVLALVELAAPLAEPALELLGTPLAAFEALAGLHQPRRRLEGLLQLGQVPLAFGQALLSGPELGLSLLEAALAGGEIRRALVRTRIEPREPVEVLDLDLDHRRDECVAAGGRFLPGSPSSPASPPRLGHVRGTGVEGIRHV